MVKAVSWLGRLRWRWRFVILGVLIILVVVVAVPAFIYYSRDRHPHDYSEMPNLAALTYLVSYDNGDGVIEQSQHTLQTVESGVTQDSIPCFHVVTLYDPYPERKFNARIVGSTNLTLGEEEIWRSLDDLRVIQKKILHTSVPIVNTVVVKETYSEYDPVPDWPYRLNDSWTYKVVYDSDTPLQPSWTDTFRAEVVADDAIVSSGNVEYRCFKVVHTLVDTTTDISPGGGVGTAIIEYWNRSNKSIGPVKIEDSVRFRGTEIQIASGEKPSIP